MLRCLILFSSPVISSSWLIVLPSRTLAIMHTYGSMRELIRVASSRSRPSSANGALLHDGSGISWDASWLRGVALSGFALGDSVASGTDGTSRSDEEGTGVSDEKALDVWGCCGMPGGKRFDA
jgi:hypothetical protein